MNPKAASQWESRRAKGRNYFVTRYGVLGWGLGFSVLFYIMQYTTGQSSGLFPDAPILLVLGLAGGYVWGLIMWHLMERLYSKTSSKG